jgi:hypothetical protein
VVSAEWLDRHYHLQEKAYAAVAPEIAQVVDKEMEKRGINMENIKEEAEQILKANRKTGTSAGKSGAPCSENIGDTLRNQSGDIAQDPQSTGSTASNLVDRLFSQGEEVVEAADSDAAVNVVMKRTGKSRAESEQIVDNWIASYNQAKEEFDTLKIKAEEQARETGRRYSFSSIKSFIVCIPGFNIRSSRVRCRRRCRKT